jgi:acyl dehydratase
VSETPGLLGSYLKAVAGALPLPLPGGRSEELGDVERTVEGVEIDRDHLARYDRVCGFRLGDALPPTYIHVLAFPMALSIMTDRSFPFGVLGLVHIENVIEHLRPVRADEVLDLRVHPAGLRDHEKGRAIDLIAEARADGELVWRGTSTYLRRGGGGGNGDGDGAAKKKRQTTPPAPPRPNAIWNVPGDIGRRYADVSGDRNPIHLHPLAAKAFGMPGAIAHGMWVKARCLAALEGTLPEALTASVSFKAPMVLPAKVAFAEGAEGDGRSFTVYDVRKGKPHVTGTVAPG